MTIRIYIDADACPVKEETYKVAVRYGLQTFVISNSFMQIPASPLITRIVVEAGPDAADDWIADHIVAGDVVVTSDIPLAARALAKEAHAIAPYGRPFTTDSIGLALAQRSLMEHIRSTGETTGGPPPFSSGNRSRFLQALDQAIAREKRKRSLTESG
ncbi:MAG: YaiI/YqxD family protein [Methylocystis sp.]|uniref:YaiI/YqxD family protein n=1 Tax=Methylocystis sp. TaxID=1911079 RepID=UPI003DA243E0